MCITIPSSARAGRESASGSPVWRWLIDSPLRLLAVGGIFSLLLSGGFALSDGSVVTPWSWFNLLFGILPFFLFGLLFHVYPEWLRGTPVRYARFGSLFFLLLGGQLAYYLSTLMADGPGVVYLLILLLGWYLSITTLKAISMLAINVRLVLVRWIDPLLKIAVLSLLAAAGGLLSGWSEWAAYALLAGLSVSLVPILLLSLLAQLSHTAGQAHIP